MTNDKSIQTILPGDPRYRQIIAAAMKANDTDTLAKLKGNTKKPIWFINSWFLYGLMASSWEPGAERSHVPIFSPQTRLDFARFDHRRKAGDDEATPELIESTIPLDTYDFLL